MFTEIHIQDMIQNRGNYIRELVRSHSEVLGIVLFLLGYLFFLNKSKGKLNIFLSGFAEPMSQSL